MLNNYKKKNTDRISLWHKENYKKNRDEILNHSREYYRKNRVKVMERTKKWTKNNAEHLRELRKKIRFDVLNFYSFGKLECACCGEKEYRFLTIDHVNGGGNKHRKEKNIGSLPMWLESRDFPEGYQVLCYNCNCGRAWNNGICPHKKSIFIQEMED